MFVNFVGPLPVFGLPVPAHEALRVAGVFTLIRTTVPLYAVVFQWPSIIAATALIADLFTFNIKMDT